MWRIIGQRIPCFLTRSISIFNKEKWIIVSNQPFSVVGEEEFIEMIKRLNPTAKLPSDKTIKSDLMTAYLEKIEEIKLQLSKIQGKISISLDIWSSKNMLPFLVIRAHWISSEWECRSQLLDFAHIQGEHDGKKICQLFLQCMGRFNIPLKKVLAFTLDNASNNDTFVTNLKKHGVDSGLNISSHGNQVRCLAHILNLVVQDLLAILKVDFFFETQDEVIDEMDGESEDAELEDSTGSGSTSDEGTSDEDVSEDEEQVEVGEGRSPLKILRKAVRKIRKSTKLRQKLKHLCGVYEVKALVPIIDVCTRWNFTYNMLQRGTHLQGPLKDLCANEKVLMPLQLSTSEWEDLNVIEEVLRKFDRATQFLSTQRRSTFASYLPVLIWLKDVLITYTYDDRSSLADAAQAGLDKLIQYIQFRFQVSFFPI